MKHTFKRLITLLLALTLLLGMLPAVVAADPAPANVARGKRVSDGGMGGSDGVYWDTSFLTDGENHDLSGGNNVGWTAKDDGTVKKDTQINLTVNLNGSYDLTKIALLPTAFDSGKFYPVAYTISVSADGKDWTQVASDTKTTVPAVAAQEYSFETKTASYVRVTITENRVEYQDDGVTVKKYMSQLGEIEVYGVPTPNQGKDDPETGEDTNLAPAAQISVTSTESGGGLYSHSALVDGKYGAYPADPQLGWCTTRDADVTFALAKPSVLSKIKLFPCTFESGKFFPSAYTISVSEDNKTWTQVASVGSVAEEEKSNTREHTLENVKASYVKIAVKTRSVLEANGNTSVYSQISEVEIYGHDAPKELTLLSANKPVTATSNHYETFFNASFLTDGIWKTYNEDGNTTLGWCCRPGDSASAENPMVVSIDLGTAGLVEKIVLKPQKWSKGEAFPKAYDLQVSENGLTWKTVASASNVDAGAADDVSVQPLTYTFTAEKARYARIRITEHSELIDTPTGSRYSAIGEFEVWGTAVESEENGNIAMGQKVTADNYFEEPDSTQHYSVLWLVDGKYTDGSKYGYSTKKGITSATDSPATLLVELEGVYDVSRVTLVPVQADRGAFFPEDYAIQLSENGTTWTDLATVTGAEAGGDAREHDAQTPVRAKYVRLKLTKHRYATDTYRGRQESLWASRLAELEVYGEAVKLDQPSINKSGLQMNAGSTDQLSVGWRVGEPLDTVTWQSSDSSVVTVDENGAVRAIANGSATITGTYPAGEKYDAGSVSCKVTISDYKATDNLMITTFWPMIRENMNQSYVNDIAEAGFTNIQLQYSLDVANYDDNMTIIDMANKAGIGVTVNEKAWGWGQITNWKDEDITAAAAKYSHIPGVVGYFLIDEPGAASQPAFYHCFKAFRDAMPEADVHFNFLGDLNGMNELMQSEAGPYVDYLMWDAYIYPNAGVRDNVLFSTSERVRTMGLRYGVKTAQYVQSCGFNGAYRRPDGDELRYNVNAALAYGNKQIAYFTYRRPEGVTESFTDAIVKEDGTRTDIYDAVKSINGAALKLGPTLMSVEALAVYHTGEQSGANKALPQDFFLQPSSSSNRGLIVSYMKNLDTKQNYVMLVNRDYENAATVSFTAAEAAGALQYVSQDDGTLKALTGSSVELAPGGCILIKTAENYDYMPNYGEKVETEAGKNAAIAENTTVQASGANKAQLTDAARIANTYTDGCGLPGYTASVGTEGHSITLNFGVSQTMNRVDIYPGDTNKFPVDFTLEGSANGESWTKIVEKTNYVLPENLACSLTFDAVKYQYLRLNVSKTASGNLQICEIEVYNDNGTVPALRKLNGAVAVDKNMRPADNLARSATAISSDNHPAGAPYWSLDKINDGVGYDAIFTAYNGGWSSAPDGSVATTPKWVGYDLGELKSVNKVIVYNAWPDRGGKKAECYPADYMIQVSSDNSKWTTVAAVYNDTNWMEAGARVFEFDAVNARYVRFYAERLGRCGEAFCLQLGELEVYGGDAIIPVDKTALNTAIAAAEALSEEDYTAESWNAMQTALTAAKAAAKDEDASQTSVDAALTALNSAVSALEEKPDAPNPPVDPNPPVNPNPPVTPTPPVRPSRPTAGSSTSVPEAKFPFTDVPRSAWFYSGVKEAWQNGLIDGMNAESFDPEGSLTLAQAIKLAACLHQMHFLGEVRLSNGSGNWFDSYVAYAVANGILEEKYAGYTLEQMNASISREEFVHIFFGAMPEDTYTAKNTVSDNAIPDVKLGGSYAKEIYTFYRAGILIGSDRKGTFHPESNIKRAEVAVILIRMYDASVRQNIELS